MSCIAASDASSIAWTPNALDPQSEVRDVTIGGHTDPPVRATQPPTALVIIGLPVSQSLSPLIQNAALRAAGIAATYGRQEVSADELLTALREFAATGIAGNVTMPHKEAVFFAADRRSPVAQRVGAVNTFWFDQHMLCAHNTDVAGILATIRALCPQGLADRRVAVLGAGGSAAAALVALDISECDEIVMWARTPARAMQIAARVDVAVSLVDHPEDAIRNAALVINCTPLGMRDNAFPVDPKLLAPDCAVFDLVYRRGETAWVRACRARGLRATDGLLMLVEQGAEAFRTWFSREPSLSAMWAALHPETRAL
jgi:shikimate dehydrogenase